ncbi:hypothetical protein D3C87_2144470 [compost metagenome]
MKQYVGLDVPQKETSVCVVDENGLLVHRRGDCLTFRHTIDDPSCFRNPTSVGAYWA